MAQWFYIKDVYSTDQCSLLNATLKVFYYYFGMFLISHCYVWIKMKRQRFFFFWIMHMKLYNILNHRISNCIIYTILHHCILMYLLFLKFRQKFHLKKTFSAFQASLGYILNTISKYLHVYWHLRGISQEVFLLKY